MSDSSEDIMALLTDRWQTTAEIVAQVEARCDPKIEGNRVRRRLASLHRFGLIERMDVPRGGNANSRHYWRRLQA